MGERDEYMREYQRAWLAARRQKAIELKGGKCVWCDRTQAEVPLEFDHTRPLYYDGLKSPGGKLWSWSWERIVAELEKCWLLCKDCHRAKTRDDRPDVIHGSAGMWHAHKCRCQECRDWMAASQRAYRARKQQRDVA